MKNLAAEWDSAATVDQNEINGDTFTVKPVEKSEWDSAVKVQVGQGPQGKPSEWDTAISVPTDNYFGKQKVEPGKDIVSWVKKAPPDSIAGVFKEAGKEVGRQSMQGVRQYIAPAVKELVNDPLKALAQTTLHPFSAKSYKEDAKVLGAVGNDALNFIGTTAYGALGFASGIMKGINHLIQTAMGSGDVDLDTINDALDITNAEAALWKWPGKEGAGSKLALAALSSIPAGIDAFFDTLKNAASSPKVKKFIDDAHYRIRVSGVPIGREIKSDDIETALDVSKKVSEMVAGAETFGKTLHVAGKGIKKGLGAEELPKLPREKDVYPTAKRPLEKLARKEAELKTTVYRIKTVLSGEPKGRAPGERVKAPRPKTAEELGVKPVPPGQKGMRPTGKPSPGQPKASGVTAEETIKAAKEKAAQGEPKDPESIAEKLNREFSNLDITFDAKWPDKELYNYTIYGATDGATITLKEGRNYRAVLDHVKKVLDKFGEKMEPRSEASKKIFDIGKKETTPPARGIIDDLLRINRLTGEKGFIDLTKKGVPGLKRSERIELQAAKRRIRQNLAIILDRVGGKVGKVADYLAKNGIQGYRLSKNSADMVQKSIEKLVKDQKTYRDYLDLTQARKKIATGKIKEGSPEFEELHKRFGPALELHAIRHYGNKPRFQVGKVNNSLASILKDSSLRGKSIYYGPRRAGDTVREIEIETPVYGKKKIKVVFDKEGNPVIEGAVFPKNEKSQARAIDDAVKRNREFADWYEDAAKVIDTFKKKGVKEEVLDKYKRIIAVLSAGSSPKKNIADFKTAIQALEKGNLKGGKGTGISVSCAKKINDIWTGKTLPKTLDEMTEAYGEKVGQYMMSILEPKDLEAVTIDRHIGRLFGYDFNINNRRGYGPYKAPVEAQFEIEQAIKKAAKRLNMSPSAVQAALWYEARPGWSMVEPSTYREAIQVKPLSLPPKLFKRTTVEPRELVHYGKDYYEIIKPSRGTERTNIYSKEVLLRKEIATKQNPMAEFSYYYSPEAAPEAMLKGKKAHIISTEGKKIYDAADDPLGYWESAAKRVKNDKDLPEHMNMEQQRIATINAFAYLIKKTGAYDGFSVKAPVGKGRWFALFDEVPVKEKPVRTRVMLSDVINDIDKLPDDPVKVAKIGDKVAPVMAKKLASELEKKYHGIRVKGAGRSVARFGDATSGETEFGLDLDLEGPPSVIEAAMADLVGLRKSQNGVIVEHSPAEIGKEPNAIRIEFDYGNLDETTAVKYLKKHNINEFNLVRKSDRLYYSEVLPLDETGLAKERKLAKVAGDLKVDDYSSSEVYTKLIGSFEDLAEAHKSYYNALRSYYGTKSATRLFREARAEGLAERAFRAASKENPWSRSKTDRPSPEITEIIERDTGPHLSRINPEEVTLETFVGNKKFKHVLEDVKKGGKAIHQDLRSIVETHGEQFYKEWLNPTRIKSLIKDTKATDRYEKLFERVLDEHRSDSPRVETISALGTEIGYEKAKKLFTEERNNPTEYAKLVGETGTLLEPVKDSPLDNAALTYLKTADIKAYLDAMPGIGGMKPGEVWRFDPNAKELFATTKTPSGKETPAIRKSGFFATKEFQDSIKGFEDISKRSAAWSDPTRLIEYMDQGRTGGPIQRAVLYPARATSLAKMKFAQKMQYEFSNILDTYGINSKAKLEAVSNVAENISSKGTRIPNQELYRRNPEIQAALRGIKKKWHSDVISAAKETREFYNQLIKWQNKARSIRGQRQIPYRRFYIPWVIESNIWEKTFGLKRRPQEIMERPELPDFVLPNQRFNARAMAREGLLENYPKIRNIAKLTYDYIDVASRDIFDTNIIHNNKIHAAVMKNQGLEVAANALNAWTSEAFAGTLPRLSRAIREAVPPGLLGPVMKIRRNLTRAVFPLNFTWNLFIQTSSSGLTYVRYGTRSAIAGLKAFTDPKIKAAIEDNAYSYIIKRSEGPIYQDVGKALGKYRKHDTTKMDKVVGYASFLTQAIEEALTRHAVAAAYNYGQRVLGLKGRELWEYASNGGAKTQSMYNYMDLPGLLRSRELTAVAPFQTFAFEIFNTVREQNIPLLRRVIGKTGEYRTIHADSMAGKALLRKRLGMLARWTAAIMVTNAVVDKAIGRKPWQLSSFIPFYGIIFGGENAKSPQMGYYRDFYRGVAHLIKYGSFKRLRKWFLRYNVPAGIQLERTIEGIEAVSKGRVEDVRGYRLYKISPDEKLWPLIAGPAATKGGREYRRKYRESRSMLRQMLKKSKKRKPMITE